MISSAVFALFAAVSATASQSTLELVQCVQKGGCSPDDYLGDWTVSTNIQTSCKPLIQSITRTETNNLQFTETCSESKTLRTACTSKTIPEITIKQEFIKYGENK